MRSRGGAIQVKVAEERQKIYFIPHCRPAPLSPLDYCRAGMCGVVNLTSQRNEDVNSHNQTLRLDSNGNGSLDNSAGWP